jgi:hypothetical protein
LTECVIAGYDFPASSRRKDFVGSVAEATRGDVE